MLLSTIYKKSQITPNTQNIISPYQRGFTPRNSATDQIFPGRRVIEKLLEYDHQLYHLLFYFKAAYESIASAKLLTAMRELGIPTKLISLNRVTLTNVRGQIKAAGSLSNHSGHLIRMDEDDPARKIYKDNIYGRKKKTRQTLPEMGRWPRTGRQIAFTNL